MHILSIFFILVLTSVTLTAQSPMEIQKEIDQTVWTPFQKAFETLDAAALNATYAADVLRVTPGGIDTENTFKKENLERFKASKENGVAIALDFWFDSRHTNAHTSYEVGFYRITATTKEGVNMSYGQFHIVLKKINGSWKITQDWDTTTIGNKPITAAVFNTKKPLNFKN